MDNHRYVDPDFNPKYVDLRNKVESDYKDIGFRSRRFKHKNEPANRQANSLWLMRGNGDGVLEKTSTLMDIEIRVQFLEHNVILTLESRVKGMCTGRPGPSATFKQTYSDFDHETIFAYIQAEIAKFDIPPRTIWF